MNKKIPIFNVLTRKKEDAKKAWYAYADSIYPNTAGRYQGCKDLIDYNLECLEQNISFETFQTYLILLIELKKDLYKDNFIGPRLNLLYSKSRKQQLEIDLLSGLLDKNIDYIEQAQLLCETRDLDLIHNVYYKTPFRLSKVLSAYVDSVSDVDDNVKFLFKSAFNAEYVRSTLHENKSVVSPHLNTLIKLGPNLHTLIRSIPEPERLENLFVLNALLDHVSDQVKIKDITISEHKELFNSICELFLEEYPDAARHYQTLRTLDVSKYDVWKNLVCDVSHSEDVPEIEFDQHML